MQLKHAFTSGKADGADTTQVQPSNWNADHDLTMAGAGLVGAKAAGAAQEIAVQLPLAIDASGNLVIQIPVSEEGAQITTAMKSLNFVGALSTATDSDGNVTITARGNTQQTFGFYDVSDPVTLVSGGGVAFTGSVNTLAWRFYDGLNCAFYANNGAPYVAITLSGHLDTDFNPHPHGQYLLAADYVPGVSLARARAITSMRL